MRRAPPALFPYGVSNSLPIGRHFRGAVAELVVAIDGGNHFSFSSRNGGDTWVQGGAFATVVGNSFGGLAYSSTLKRLSICESQNFTPDAAFSDDLGASWTVYTSVAGHNEYRMVFCFGQFFFGSGSAGGVYASASGAGAWAPVAGTLNSLYGLHFAPSLPMLACCGDNGGVAPRTYYSTDGATFNLGSVAGIAGTTFYIAQYDPDRALWFGVDNAGRVYSNPDFVAGAWTPLGAVSAPAGIVKNRFAFVPGGVGKPIACVTGADVFVSTDNGATFVSKVAAGSFDDILYLPTAGKLVAVGTKIYNSKDQGATWTDRTGALPIAELTAAVRVA